MTKREHLTGQTQWSLKVAFAPDGETAQWTLAGVHYRKGLPELVVLEQGSVACAPGSRRELEALIAMESVIRMILGSDQ